MWRLDISTFQLTTHQQFFSLLFLLTGILSQGVYILLEGGACVLLQWVLITLCIVFAYNKFQPIVTGFVMFHTVTPLTPDSSQGGDDVLLGPCYGCSAPFFSYPLFLQTDLGGGKMGYCALTQGMRI